MTYRADYLRVEPLLSEVGRMPGPVVLEFGAPWCGHCHVAQAAIRSWLEGANGVTHLKVEDGKGRPLGRAFAIRRWPTLVVVDAGKECARVVRPTAASDLEELRQVVERATPLATR